MGIQSKMKQWTRTESKGDFSQTIFFFVDYENVFAEEYEKIKRTKTRKKKVKANDELRTIFFFVGKIPWGGRKKRNETHSRSYFEGERLQFTFW